MMNCTRREALGAAAVAAGLAALSTAARAAEGPAKDELPTFRYALEQQRGKVMEGGSAKEASVKELPVSTGLAGVSMRLKPGGLRELHWHANAAEWAFVIKGRVRTTVLGPDGTSQINDFNSGDVWYFPRGHGHALQGLGPDEFHFILVFDNGSFSEFGTFSSTDWLGHTPPEVLGQALGVPRAALAQLPKTELYIVKGPVPPDRPGARRQGGLRTAPQTHRYPLLAQLPSEQFAGGVERRVTVKEFPISTTISGVVLDLKPGALREPHWHPNANEWQYYMTGRARMTVFGSGGRARTEEFSAGNVGYVPQGYGHYIENLGEAPCRVLIAFDNGAYQEISLSTWLASNPVRLVAQNFHLAEGVVAKFPDQRVFIAAKEGPGRSRGR